MAKAKGRRDRNFTKSDLSHIRMNEASMLQYCRVDVDADFRTTSLKHAQSVLGTDEQGVPLADIFDTDSARRYVADMCELRETLRQAAEEAKLKSWPDPLPSNEYSALDLRQWKPYPATRWRIRRCRATTVSRGDISTQEHYLVTAEPLIRANQDFRIEYKAEARGKAADLTLVVGGPLHVGIKAGQGSHLAQRPDDKGYCFAFGAKNNCSTELQRLALPIAATPKIRIAPGKKHLCVAERIGGLLRFSVDGNLVYEVLDALPLLGREHGHVAFYAYSDNESFWDLKIFTRPTCISSSLRKKIRELQNVVLEMNSHPTAYIEAHYLGPGRFIFKDVTDIVELQRKLEAQKQQAEKIQALLHMAGATAHEMNQPLTIIMGYVDLILQKVDKGVTPEFDEELRELKQNTARLAKIVKKIGRIQSYKIMPYAGDDSILDIDASSGG